MTRAGALALASVFCLAGAARAQMVSLDVLDREFKRIVDSVAPAVVRIGPGFTGVCISENGFVLTDGQVAAGFRDDPQIRAKGIAVTFPDKRSFMAQLVTAHAATNTALLKLDTKRVPYARPGDPGSLAVGHFLLSIGNAFNTAAESGPAVTLGIVSAIRRDEGGRAELLETSAATNPGQDGCPYFDVDGQLVGLFRQLPTLQNLATVTPIDIVRSAYADVPGADDAFPPPRTVLPPRTRAKALSTAFNAAATKARGSIVTLLVTRAPPAALPATEPAGAQAPIAKPEPPRGPPALLRDGPVTGTIVDARGFVFAPSNAFTADVTAIEALLADGRRLRASVLAHDRKAGLALLLLDTPKGSRFETLEAVAASGLQHGQFVIAVGAPHGPPVGAEPFMTVGVVSALHRLDPWRDAIETDAGTNVKNAGGALVDIRGRLVGIVLAPEWPFGQNSGLGFAMPFEAVTAALERMAQGVDIEPAYLGVTLNDLANPQRGVVVIEIAKGFPAEAAGVQVGDFVIACDGRPITDRRGFSDFMARSKCAGDTVKLSIRRGGLALEVVATLVKRPG